MNILQTLEQARNNLVKSTTLAHKQIGRPQLDDAVTLLTKGYPLTADVDELKKEYGDAEHAPDYVTKDKPQGDAAIKGGEPVVYTDSNPDKEDI